MWDIYLGGEPQGIAIRSTYRRLSESITDERKVYIGTVSYIDFNAEVIPDGNGFYPYVHKRKSFEHEREIRALCRERIWANDDGRDDAVRYSPIGAETIRIQVDLDELVEAV